MPPCPPSATLLPSAGRGSVIQAATNCSGGGGGGYQPNGGQPANLNDLYYMDFGAPTGAAAAAAAMYHQKAKKKAKKYNVRPATIGSPGAVQQSSCSPATGPKRKSREGESCSPPPRISAKRFLNIFGSNR